MKERKMRILDRFDLMRLFVRIAEVGSLSAAARAMGLSQPSVSRQLKQLESLLRVQLVQRSTRELTLTDAGKRFLEDARAMLADWENSAESLRTERDELRGLIRAAAPVALGQTLLAKIASRFLLRHPSVSIDWRLVDEPGDLVAGGYDLWIRAGPILDQNLIVRELWRIDRTIVAAAGSFAAADPKELVERAAVVLRTYVTREMPFEGPRKQKTVLKQKAAFTTDNLFAAIVAVREGAGYGILPFWSIQEDLDAGRLIQLCPSWRPSPLKLSVAYPPTRYRPVRINAFLDFLRSELPKTGAGISSTS
jgi:molybdate transport repressor ModE-like protein